ncbi:MAG TPA: RDD family protein [Actinomycetota bacterium]
MPFCGSCGNELSAYAVTCPQCGHPGPAAASERSVGQYAGWWQRVAAYLIDGLVLAPAGLAIGLLAGPPFEPVYDARGDLVDFDVDPVQVRRFVYGLLLVAVVQGLYKVLLEGGQRGQTVGKMVLRIAVVDLRDRASIGHGRAFVRFLVGWILWWLFYLPGILDVLFPLWDGRRQAIHDKAARSVVVTV